MVPESLGLEEGADLPIAMWRQVGLREERAAR
jgi:hypothetical protein